MASTLGPVRKEAYRWMRETNPNDYAVTVRPMNRIIEAELHRVGSKVKLGQAWQAGAITLNPATDPPDYALPTAGAIQYAQVIALRRGSDKWPLRKLSQDQIEGRRAITTPLSNKVLTYALREATDQTVTVLFGERPTAADTVDVLRSVIPAALADADAAVIPFDRDLLEGFQQGCAARGCRMMTAQQREARGIAEDHIQALERAASAAEQEAVLRVVSLKLGDDPNWLYNTGWWPWL